MKTTISISLCLILILTASYEVHSDDIFSISKNLKTKNMHPAIASNADGSTLIVVWQYLKDNSGDISNIYFAPLRFKRGKIRVGKAKMISNPANLASLPDVTFNSKTKQFLIVWGSKRIIGGMANRYIAGRFANSKGKISKGIIKVVSDPNDFSLNPKIVSLSDNSLDSHISGNQPAYFLIWFHKTLGANIEDSGLYDTFLDENGSAISDPRFVFGADVDAQKALIADIGLGNLVRSDNGKGYYLACTYNKMLDAGSVTTADVNQIATVLSVDSSGKKKKSVELEESKILGIKIVRLSSKLFLCSWNRINNPYVLNQLLKSTLVRKKKHYEPFGDGSGFGFMTCENPKGGAYQFIYDSEGVFLTKINAKGKTVGKPELTDIPYFDQRAKALVIPGSNKILVVWQKSEDGVFELVGTLIDY